MACEQLARFNEVLPSRLLESPGPATHFSLKGRVIQYPVYLGARDRIARLHARGVVAGTAEGLLLTGPAGSGKSTLLASYAASFPPEESKDRTVIPVLMVDTPSGPTVKNLTEVILRTLGDPLATRGSAETKTRRIYWLLKECRVQLLVIDEFNHFYDSSDRRQATQVTDWLKNVINVAQIPVVLAGLPRSESVVRANPQLARRFSSRYSLRPFAFGSETEQFEFRALLRALQSSLPLPAPILYEANLARRFFIASAGLIDFVIKTIEGAVVAAALEDASELALHHFAEGFREKVWRDAPDALNPFSENSVLRPLTRVGEPFELWEGTGDPVRRAREMAVPKKGGRL